MFCQKKYILLFFIIFNSSVSFAQELKINNIFVENKKLELIQNIPKTKILAYEILKNYSSNIVINKNILSVTRNTDNNTLDLNLNTGQLFFKNNSIGFIPNFTNNDIEIFEIDKIFLDIKSIEVLTGSNAKVDNSNLYFVLDSRLGIYGEFPIEFNNKIIFNAKSKIVGKKIFLSLKEISDELGYTYKENINEIEFYRPNDVARVIFNKKNGLININKKDIGIFTNVDFIDKNLYSSELIKILLAVDVDISFVEKKILLSLHDRLKNTVSPNKLISEEIDKQKFELIDFNSQNYFPGGNYNTLTAQHKNYFYKAQINNDFENNINSYRIDINDIWGPNYSIGSINANNKETLSIGNYSLIGFNAYIPKDDYAISFITGKFDNTNDEQLNGSVIGLKYLPRYDKNKLINWDATVTNVNNKNLDISYNLFGLGLKSNKYSDKYFQSDIEFGIKKQNNITNNILKTKIYNNLFLGKNKDILLYNDLSYTSKYFNDSQTVEDINTNTSYLIYRSEINNSIKLSLPGLKIKESSHYLSFYNNYNQLISENNNENKSTVNYGASFSGTINKDFYYSFDLMKNIIKEKISGTNENFLTLSLDLNKKFSNGDLSFKIANNFQNNESVGSLFYNFEPFEFKLKNVEKPFVLNLSAGSYFIKNNNNTKITPIINNNVSYSKEFYKFKTNLGYSINTSYNNDERKLITNNYFYLKAEKNFFDNSKFFFTISQDINNKFKLFIGLDLNKKFNRAKTSNHLKNDNGILEGIIYLKNNENQKIQTNIKIKKTAISLLTDSKGNFTIQNIPPGVYELEIDTSNLPLNYKLEDDKNIYFAIESGKITELKIPVIITYSIKGRVKNAEDGDTVSVFDINNIKIAETTTGFAGYYTFDNILPGKYNIYYKQEKKCFIEIKEEQKKNYSCEN